jgi:hypothetical protein
MKSTALIFAFVETAGADSERKLRKCLAALEKPETKMNRSRKSAADANQFWTWFIENPRPQLSK